MAQRDCALEAAINRSYRRHRRYAPRGRPGPAPLYPSYDPGESAGRPLGRRGGAAGKSSTGRGTAAVLDRPRPTAAPFPPNPAPTRAGLGPTMQLCLPAKCSRASRQWSNN